MWEIFEQLTSQVRTGGLGGVFGFDYSVLPVLFDVHQVPPEEHFFYFIKLNELFKVGMKYWNKKKEDTKNAAAP